jgi:glycosyltransferase involved in cell wall biosynthesis
MTQARRILVVSQFFAPESAAPAARFHDFGRRWVDEGREVTVLTGLPNFPSGVVPQAYRGTVFGSETIDGVRVLRHWLYASPKLGFATKGAGYLSFAATASLRATLAPVLADLRPDVVVATLPPPTVGIPAMVAAGLARAPLVVDVRDIWPEAVVASGKLRNPLLRHGLEGVARLLYGAARSVVVVSQGKASRLGELGVDTRKLHVIPNGIDLTLAARARPVPELWRSFGVPDDAWKLLYAGIHNPPQGLDILLSMAELVRQQRPDLWRRLRVVLVGSGSVKAALQERARAAGLEHVVFAPEQSREVIPSLLASAEASVVPLKVRKDTHTVPSKLFESLGAGKPVLVSLDGEAADIARASGGALVTPPEDAAALAKALITLMDAPTQAAAMGIAGKHFVGEQFNRDVLGRRFLDVLDRAVAGRSG